MAKVLSLVVGVASVGALGSNARADDNQDDMTYEKLDAYSYGWSEPSMRSQIGVGFILGGGVSGFTDSAMRDVVKNDIGGLWNLRASIGTHIPIGLDVSYLGTASPLQTLGGIDNGTLVGTTVEGAVRYNLLPHYAWNPYAFAGIGWQRYDVSRPTFATSDSGLNTKDDAVEFPMGAGISYRDPAGLVVDLRGTFRAVNNPGLLTESSGDQAQLHTWEASGAVGYEF